jgi:hypothetical protein
MKELLDVCLLRGRKGEIPVLKPKIMGEELSSRAL